jgi:heme-degrading monooxygenase HmoA
MFARVSTLQGPPERLDEAARMLQEEAVPFARQQPGFKAAYWLADRSTGTVVAVSLWESEEAMRASEARGRATPPAVRSGAGRDDRERQAVRSHRPRLSG